MQPSDYQNVLVAVTATISANGTASNVIDIFGMSILGIYTPPSWTSATLSLQASNDNQNDFVTIADATAVAISLPITANQYVPLIPSLFAGVQYAKLVSSVPQINTCDFKLVLGPIFNAENVG